jgi:hypothetical protein
MRLSQPVRKPQTQAPLSVLIIFSLTLMVVITLIGYAYTRDNSEASTGDNLRVSANNGKKISDEYLSQSQMNKLSKLETLLVRIENKLEGVESLPKNIDQLLAVRMNTLVTSLATRPEVGPNNPPQVEDSSSISDHLQASKVIKTVVSNLHSVGSSVSLKDAILFKPVIVGMAKDINVQNLVNFLSSARKVMPNVDIVIFTDANIEGNSEIGEVYRLFSVKVQKFSLDLFPDFMKSYHPSSYRWIMIRDWMKSIPESERYTSVLLIDVRDSVFQTNPFEPMASVGKGFYAFQEAKPRTIAECGWNSKWVSDCFGQNGLNEVANFVISCSGTSMGTWSEAYAYVDLMANEIRSNKCERNGVDQGMHNYFLYSTKLEQVIKKDDIHILSNEEGWIASIQSMKRVVRDRAGMVLNDKNEPYAVVHQYDRVNQLQVQYDTVYKWYSSNDLEIIR